MWCLWFQKKSGDIVLEDYHKILNQIYRKLGKGVTTNHQLLKVGKSMFGNAFRGVFPQDKAPRTLKNGDMLILNTHKASQPGEHWVAVMIQNNTAHIYDSYGRASAKLLPYFVKQIKHRYADSDPDAEQAKKENSCGARSIAWLLYAKQHGLQKAMKI